MIGREGRSIGSTFFCHGKVNTSIIGDQKSIKFFVMEKLTLVLLETKSQLKTCLTQFEATILGKSQHTVHCNGDIRNGKLKAKVCESVSNANVYSN